MDEDLSGHIGLTLDERATRALHAAVCFTLDKWTGQEKIDQEELQGLKPFLRKAILEFEFMK
jgi:hypothetical protein